MKMTPQGGNQTRDLQTTGNTKLALRDLNPRPHTVSGGEKGRRGGTVLV